MKKILLALLSITAAYSIFSLVIWHLTDGFSLKNIKSELASSTQWEVKNPPAAAVEDIFNQNFTYLARGSQCYVFESEDKQVVLKFFRHNRYRMPKIAQYYPAFLDRLQQKKRREKQQKQIKLFQSCVIAFNELHDECGLLYLHLNKTRQLYPNTITLYDKLKRAYTIKLDDYEFIIQKRAEHIIPFLERLMAQDRQDEAKKALEGLSRLICNRLNKNIMDHDAVIHKNTGFCAHQPLFLDIGEFYHQKCSNTYHPLCKETEHLRNWLRTKDPELAAHFNYIINTSIH